VTYGWSVPPIGAVDQPLTVIDEDTDLPLNVAIEYNWRPRIGDLNLDGAVDIADLDLLAAHYGKTFVLPLGLLQWGNLDNQGASPSVVDIFDFVVVAKFFGKPYVCIRDPDLTLCWPN